MQTPDEVRAKRAAYAREYRRRRGEAHLKWHREWMRAYRSGPRSVELREQRKRHSRESRERKKAEMEALKRRIQQLEKGDRCE